MYNTKAVQNAAIAQPVERILGKDEVASSNLASSSKKRPPSRVVFFLELLTELAKPGQIWGATRPPPVAEKGRGASGSGRQDASPLCRRSICRVPQQESSIKTPIQTDGRFLIQYQKCSQNQRSIFS